MSKALAERFAEKVAPPNRNGCIEWIGGKADHGYGQISVNGRKQRAHRVAWERAHGPIPAGISVLHKCDNPPCVNVDHLFLGSHLENMRDCALKGRTGWKTHSGEANGNAKLTEADAVMILQSKEPSSVLAARLGVSYVTVWEVRRGMRWRHVHDALARTKPGGQG